VPGFAGFRFHDVLGRSRTRERLEMAAARLGLEMAEKWQLPAPEIDLAGQADLVRAAVSKRMRRREDYFRQRGGLEVRRFDKSEEILQQLPEFFDQHIARYQGREEASDLADRAQQACFERQIHLAGPSGWLRFLRLDWQGRPIAFEFGWSYHGAYYGVSRCFAIDLADRSPGQVLQRQSLLAALEEGLRVYDYGPGDHPYKYLVFTHVKHCCTWGLYEPSSSDLELPDQEST
jgi:CelD/BcsL family acetyltransferase involved in cellulose biosynthesis